MKDVLPNHEGAGCGKCRIITSKTLLYKNKPKLVDQFERNLFKVCVFLSSKQ